MSDIFSDEILTAPPRQIQRTVTGFIAHTPRQAIKLRDDMAEFAVRENRALGSSSGHDARRYENHGKTSQQIGASTDQRILDAVAEFGVTTSVAVATRIGMNQNNTSLRMSRLFNAGRLKRSRRAGSGICWLYRVAQPTQSRSTGENVGVTEYRNEVQA